jgi:HSP20 family protein
MATVMNPRTVGAGHERGERAPHTVSPPADIYETEKTYVVVADMPGVAPAGLSVEAERGTLIIRGRPERPATPPDYQEFELGEYYRAFALTEDLNTDGITAVLRDGVLRVEIPKSVQTQPRKIPVKTE